MPMSDFILANLESILNDWEKFLETTLPGANLDRKALRLEAASILIGIARDLRTPRPPLERRAQSRGSRPEPGPPLLNDTSAQMHATHRLSHGFDLNELVWEYCALRNSVIRLWTGPMGSADRPQLHELTPFNEAFDEALSEAVGRYAARISRGKDLLLGVLGHDLRNPLGAILQSAQFLLKAGTLDKQCTTAASRILSSGTRMQHLICDLLDFSRTRLGDRLPINPCLMNISDACHRVINEIGALCPDHPVSLQCSGDMTGSWDAGRIDQMLSNLIGNAVQHGATDAPISVAIEGNPDEVAVTVHNRGTPIPDAEIHRIFEPLARANDSPSRPESAHSMGLGLYIAREVATAHGGSLELVSSGDSGTTFTARLPRRAAPTL